MNNFFKYITLFTFTFSSSIYADVIEDLILPEGFKISIYAENIKSARQIAESKDGNIFVGSKSGDSVMALIDSDNDNYAETKITVASGLSNPTGVALKNGDLYFSEIDKIWIIKNIDEYMQSGAYEELPLKEIYTDQLPSDSWHGWKWLGFGPDNSLYVPVGAPCNICIEPLQKDYRYASIHKVKEDGSMEVVASGVRNSVGFDWHPGTKKLYFSDNGRDWLGDDSPSCELNVVNGEGDFFGYPYKHASDVFDPKYGNIMVNKEFNDPILELGAHVAPTGIAFYDGNAFPEDYKNDLFITLHGSWNRTKKVGYKVISVSFDDEGNYVSHADFISGWLQGQKVSGRPAAVFVKSDGSLLISDDKANVVYRVTYSPDLI